MRIASLRLTSGSTAVHSDMIEWNLKETPENVGRAIINSIFGVVQYSAMLKDIPQEHLEVIKKWISFTSEHRETLLHSEFRPHHPELGYPVIEAESDTERIVAVYQDNVVVEAAPRGKRLYILNASDSERIVIRRGEKLRLEGNTEAYAAYQRGDGGEEHVELQLCPENLPRGDGERAGYPETLALEGYSGRGEYIHRREQA